MEISDIFWAFAWGFAGLIVFETRTVKRLLEIIGIALSGISFLALITKQTPLSEYIQGMPISYIGGLITHYFYLIGANIGRVEHMGVSFAWGRVLIYGIILIGLILFINHINPIDFSHFRIY